MDLKAHLDINDIIDSDNVAEDLHDDDLATIAADTWQGYMSDKNSRADWEQRTADGNEMALQVLHAKTTPWEGASNMRFPLLTLAAMQYHARAYPALIPNDQVVGCRVIGDDPTGEVTKKARRISEHMSYQLMEEDPEWEEGTDKLLFIHSLVGLCFKKTYYDAVAEIKRSELVLPTDLVVDYFAKSLETAARITHVIELSSNQIKERESAGIYLKTDDDEKETAERQPEDVFDDAVDRRTGVEDSGGGGKPRQFLEQHCWLDLDGDGYKEPYIVVLNGSTQKIARIVARFHKENIRWTKEKPISLVSIQAENYFTKFPFIPAPDGSFYDIGFCTLLNGVNAGIDTLANQIIDAGTMANTKGGFLGRGVKIRGGDYSFRPNEWKRTDSTGDDLKNNIVPLPVGEPSPVLFQMMSLFIDIGQKIGMATDPMVGENPGQNTPAETSRNTIAQGQKVFNAVYKRVYRSLKSEFKKLYRLNYLYPPKNGKYDYTANGSGGAALATDYTPKAFGVVPSADPYITSDEQAQTQANDLYQLLTGPLGHMLNPQDVMNRILTSRKVINQKSLLTMAPPPPPPPDPKIVVAQLEAQTAAANLQYKYAELLANTQQQLQENNLEQQTAQARIQNLEAQAALFTSQAQGQADNAQIAEVDAQIGAAKLHQSMLDRQQQDIQHQRDTFMSLLEHNRNVKKDANDAKQIGVG